MQEVADVLAEPTGINATLDVSAVFEFCGSLMIRIYRRMIYMMNS